MIPVVTADEMRALEGKLVESGIPIDTLIGIAGAAVARCVMMCAPTGRILVLAGPGNNGRDGVLAGRLLQSAGRQVSLYGYKRSDFFGAAGDAVRSEDDPDQRVLVQLLQSSSVVVDALLGIGRKRPLEGLLAAVVTTANERRSTDAIAIAVDIPTGVDSDSGAVQGIAFRADRTVGMGALKRGSSVYPGAGYSGEVEVAQMGITSAMTSSVPVTLSTRMGVARIFPDRRSESNKGTYGRVLFIGGSRDFAGAPAMSSLAAYRSGAGLVEVAVPASIKPAVAGNNLEAIFLSVGEEDGQLSPASVTEIAPALQKASSVIVGPGMGLSSNTIGAVHSLLDAMQSANTNAAVIDADALNALAQLPRWWETSTPLVLTPHPGEMSRLTNLPVGEIQSNRLHTAMHFAREWGKVVVLKGAGTIVAHPDGRAAINPTGGPNLATAGTGDVLSGIIGGLLAQGCSPWNAAVAGTYLHGKAGDMLRKQHGDAGTIASDLLSVLPAARKSVQEEGEDRA